MLKGNWWTVLKSLTPWLRTLFHGISVLYLPYNWDLLIPIVIIITYYHNLLWFSLFSISLSHSLIYDSFELISSTFLSLKSLSQQLFLGEPNLRQFPTHWNLLSLNSLGIIEPVSFSLSNCWIHSSKAFAVNWYANCMVTHTVIWGYRSLNRIN